MEADAEPRHEALTVEFGNGHRAGLVGAGRRRSTRSLLDALELTASQPVVVVIGGADTLDPAIGSQLQRLFERAAIPAAESTGALIVDGGTDSGVMAALGRAAAATATTVNMLGVAPAGKVTFPGDTRSTRGSNQLESNHTHFLLANSSEWGGETTLLFDAVEALSAGRPAAALIASGGPVTIDEVTLATRLGMPMVVVAGTGGVADELAAAAESARGRSAAATDERMASLVAAADLTVVPLTADASELERLITRLLQDDQSLHNAWRQHAIVARTARRQQSSYRRGEKLILGLGVFLTLLVATHVVVERLPAATFAALLLSQQQLLELLHYSIVLVPIVMTVLIAAASRFRPGNNWVLLRGTAEAIKHEIYRYRARAGKYSHAETRRTPRQLKLAQAVGSAVGTLMRTDVSMAPLESVEADGGSTPVSVAAGDDGFSRLPPAAYIKFRIDDQIKFYRTRARRHERDARRLRWLMLLFGGLGTFLAAIGFEIWVAVTTAATGAFASYLQSQQLETTVMLYNQAATDLDSIKAWWLALPPHEQSRPSTVDRLVERAEHILRAEQAGWVQEMQDAMTELQLEREQRDGRQVGQAQPVDTPAGDAAARGPRQAQDGLPVRDSSP